MADSKGIQVRFPRGRYAELTDAATKIGISPSTYLRVAALEKLERDGREARNDGN